MQHDEMEAKLHRMTELKLELEAVREQQARERARARVMLRDDVVSCEIREDGTLLCVDFNGIVCIRPAGWRGRA